MTSSTTAAMPYAQRLGTGGLRQGYAITSSVKVVPARQRTASRFTPPARAIRRVIWVSSRIANRCRNTDPASPGRVAPPRPSAVASSRAAAGGRSITALQSRVTFAAGRGK